MAGRNKEKWYRDPVWQFLGSVIALVAIGVSIWFFFLQRDVKSVQVVVLSETSLVDIADAVAGDVQVTYQGKPIPNLTLVQVKVENNGTAEVRSADYEGPITFAFPKGVEVLDAQVLETKPVDLGLQVEKQGSKVALSAVLLNVGDRAIIKFVLAGVPTGWSASTLAVSGRIAGVNEIRLVSALAEQRPDGGAFGSSSPSFGVVFAFISLIVAIASLMGTISRLIRDSQEREMDNYSALRDDEKRSGLQQGK